MHFRTAGPAFLIYVLATTPAIRAQQPSLDAQIDRQLPTLVTTYKALHAAPELSHQEARTSALLAAELRSLGFTVTEHVGRYPTPGLVGYGVVAVLRNGAGPTVLVRTDLDALPVEEKTGLAYASQVREKNDAGVDSPVMHACGHDIHITSLIGTARMLTQLKGQWHGTLVLIGQPAEETIDGARAMLADSLYTRFPKPDFAIALHDTGDLPTGKVSYTSGYALASSTSVDILVRGIGGHGARPEKSKDPVVLSAQIILALQTIVSREIAPLDAAVVTVGTIHGGTKRNIIPDEVLLQLTVRAYKEEVRQHLLSSIARIARGTAIAAGIPDERAPVVTVSATEIAPATYNDPALSERMAATFISALGAGNVIKADPVMGSEDFGNFGLEGHQIPTFMFFVGATAPELLEESARTGVPVPNLHSALFAPVPATTIRTGIKAMTSAVLELMKR
ncbi:MAG: amidohydrolase [Gemmatimonadota bacterium]